MVFVQIDAGGDRNFAYLVGDREGGHGALIDPPPNSRRYMDALSASRLTIDYVVVTHGHGDHTWGVSEAKERFSCKVVAHRSMLLPIDVPVDDGDVVKLGDLELRVIYTPGHSDDHICILAGDNLVTGDLLFVGKVGGTDLAEGARRQYASLHEKILTLDPNILVWPGHNFGAQPSSTIGHEKQTNPFLTRESFQAFLDLKMNWLQYKKEHGIQ